MRTPMSTVIENARHTYNIKHWSDGYFDINEHGNLVAYPNKNRERAGICFNQLTQDFIKQGLTLPVLVRFTDILQSRVDTLVNAFGSVREQKNYRGEYTCVYPIKVNQQYSVVTKLLEHPSNKVGLEAGSKPELMAILGVANRPISIVCNGYKDSEFLRLACIAQEMGHHVHIVIEKLSELDALLHELETLPTKPSIGIRIKLNSVGKGKWQNTGGEKGKFGLTAGQVLQAVNKLKAVNKLELLQLVHFHIGSQVANIRDIHLALKECARHFAELYEMGVPLNTVDVGGGLGVDYEGSGSRSACSMNYTVEEYAKNVVAAFADICEQKSLPEPNIITESGRALTAHHAVLITDVIDIETPPKLAREFAIADDAPQILAEMTAIRTSLNARLAIETYHDAMHLFSEAHEQYVHGLLSLRDWSQIELLYFDVLQQVHELLDPQSRSHRDIIDDLNEKLANKLFVNFSLFQSLPDIWGIEQIFPIMPTERLNEPLSQRRYFARYNL